MEVVVEDQFGRLPREGTGPGNVVEGGPSKAVANPQVTPVPDQTRKELVVGALANQTQHRIPKGVAGIGTDPARQQPIQQPHILAVHGVHQPCTKGSQLKGSRFKPVPGFFARYGLAGIPPFLEQNHEILLRRPIKRCHQWFGAVALELHLATASTMDPAWRWFRRR